MPTNLPDRRCRPVSYTHLDVYKRQECGSFRSCANAGKRKAATSIIPVSYTHLDVYKRQVEAVTVGSAACESVKFYGKLGEIEEEMPSFFIRIHNRYLVNLKYVDKLEGSSLECGGQILPVSRAYKQTAAVAFAKLMLK